MKRLREKYARIASTLAKGPTTPSSRVHPSISRIKRQLVAHIERTNSQNQVIGSSQERERQVERDKWIEIRQRAKTSEGL